MKIANVVLAVLILSFYGCTTISNKQTNSEISFEIIKGIPVIDVSINGVTAKLGIDTGAGNNEICLNKELIQKAGLRTISGNTQNYDINGEKHISKGYLAKRVMINNYVYDDINISQEDRDVPFDGIIGNRFLEKISIISIDYKKHILTFINKNNFSKVIDKGQWYKIKYTRSKEGIILPVTFNGLNYSFVFDTGMAVFVNDDVYGIINKKIFEQIKSTNDKQSIKLQNVEIGLHHYDSLFFYAVELPEIFTADGLLGYNILRNSTIIIDYDNHDIYMEKMNVN